MFADRSFRRFARQSRMRGARHWARGPALCLESELRPLQARPRHALLLLPFRTRVGGAASGGAEDLLARMARSTPREWSLIAWDERRRAGRPPCEPFPEVVGVLVDPAWRDRALELARWYTARGARVALGGPGVRRGFAGMACLFGELAPAWNELLRDAAVGRLRPVYRGWPVTP